MLKTVFLCCAKMVTGPHKHCTRKLDLFRTCRTMSSLTDCFGDKCPPHILHAAALTAYKKTLAQMPDPQFSNRPVMTSKEVCFPRKKNEDLKNQETKKPMNTKSDADQHKNNTRKSEKIVSNHEADETKDLSTPRLQRIVLLQQY
ncbi:hypothetical protein WA026_021146 [Henosepilachna vigintioctopunctata]|uniref:Uncharacterized protein n=1 Tax=Henosepilachna vigintioctopunctata TaxID=420089 RepID=A0AAW1UFT7_9CUCU